MKNKYKTVFLPFVSLDYKALEVYLEDMAKSGWMLEKFRFLTAKFRAIEPKNIKFYIDVCEHGGPFTPENTRENKVYRRNCEELGWSFITSQHYLQFFYAEEGQDPEPIQRDEETEFTIVKKTLLKNELISLIISIIAQYVIIRNSFPIKYTSLLSFMGLGITFGFPLLTISTIYTTIHILTWLFKNSRSIKKGLPIETPTVRSARKRGKIINGLALIFGTALAIAITMDLLITPNVSIVPIFPVLLGPFIGFLLRHLIKKKAKDKGDTILYIVVGIVSVILVSNVIGSIYFSRAMKTSNHVDSIPEGYPILTIEHISEIAREGNLESREFKPGKSPLVPKYYDFWENWNINGKRKRMNIYYYEAISPYFTEVIFNGKSEGINRVLGWSNKSLIEDGKVKGLYRADQFLISPDRDVVLIQKGNKVVHLLGDVDFGDMRVIEQIVDKIF